MNVQGVPRRGGVLSGAADHAILTDITDEATDEVSERAENKPAGTAAKARPTRAQRLVAFTFLGAFGATMVTVVLTGLSVRSAGSRSVPEAAAVSLTIGMPHTVNLLFESRAPVAGVEFTLDLPEGIALRGREGEQRFVWHSPLVLGSNLLPLELVAQGGRGGQLAARLRHADAQKIFVVDISVER